MKKALMVIMCLFIINSIAYSYDYEFEIKDAFVKDYLSKFKKQFEEAGIDNLVINLKDQGRIEVEFEFGMLGIDVNVDLRLAQQKTNEFQLYVTKLKVMGFLPFSRKTAAEKIVGAINDCPALKGILSSYIFKTNSGSKDSDLGVNIKFIKSPVDIVENLDIARMTISNGLIRISGFVDLDI